MNHEDFQENADVWQYAGADGKPAVIRSGLRCNLSGNGK